MQLGWLHLGAGPPGWIWRKFQILQATVDRFAPCLSHVRLDGGLRFYLSHQNLLSASVEQVGVN